MLVISGFIGVVVGLYPQTLAGFWHAAMWFGVLLWHVANADTGTTWAPKVNYCREVLVAFGGMATIGFALNMLLTF